MPLTPSSPLSYSTTSLPDLRVRLAGQQRPCVKSENMEIDSKSLASEISLECLEGKMKRSLKTMDIWGILKRLTLHLEYCRPQLSYTTWFPTILGLISLQKSFFGVRFNALIECTERFEACCIGLRSLPMQKSICSLRTKALHHPLSLSWTHHHPIIAQLSNLDANFVRSLRHLCAIGWRHSSNSIYFCIMSVDMKKWKCIQDKLGEKGFRWLKPFDHHLILKAETGLANWADLLQTVS